MSFLRNILSVFSTRILVRILAFGTTVIVARLLGPAGQGMVALALFAPVFLTQLAGLDLEVSNTYHTARDRRREGELLGNTALFCTIISIPALSLFILFFNFISENFLQNMGLNIVGIALLIFPLSLLTTTIRGILLGKENFKLYNIMLIIINAVTLIFAVIYLIVLKKGIKECMIAYLFGNIAGLLMLFIAYILPKIKKISLNWKLFLSQIKYGVKPYTANLFGLLNYRVDLLLVSFFLDPANVGIYALALGLVGRLVEIPQSIQTVFFPKTTAQTDEEANIYTPNLYRRVGIIMVVVGIITGFLGWLFIPLVFGEDFRRSIVPLLIFILGRIIIRGNVGILSTDLNGRGLPHFIALVSLLCFLSSVVLNLIAIPRWGIIGASIATSTTSLIQSVAMLLIYKRVSGLPFRDFIPKFSDIRTIYEKTLGRYLPFHKTE